MEPVQGSTFGHTQLDYMNTVLYNNCPCNGGPSTTVSQELVLAAGNLLFSILMIHVGWAKLS